MVDGFTVLAVGSTARMRRLMVFGHEASLIKDRKTKNTICILFIDKKRKKTSNDER